MVENVVRSLSRCGDSFCILDEVDKLGNKVLEYFDYVKSFLEKAFSEFSCLSVDEVKSRYKNIASLWGDVYKQLFWRSCRPPADKLMLIEGLDIPKRIETLFRMHLSKIPNATEPEVLHLIQRFLDTISSRYRGELLSGLRDAAIYGFLTRVSDILSSIGLTVADVIEEFLEKESIESLVDAVSERYVKEHKLDKFVSIVVERLRKCRIGEGYDSTCIVKVLDDVIERIYLELGNEYLARYILLYKDVRKALSSVPCAEIARRIRASTRLRNSRIQSIVFDICRSPIIEPNLDLSEKESVAKYIAHRWAEHALREIESLATDRAITAVIEECYIRGVRQIPREFVTDKTLSMYRDQFIRSIKTGLPSYLRYHLDIEGILNRSAKVREAEFEQRVESAVFRGREIDIDNLVDLVTYDPATLDFNKFYERLESIAKVVREFCIVKGLQEGISSEIANVITKVLQNERTSKAIARSALCREHRSPIEPSANLYPNLYEIKNQVLEILSNIMSKVKCGHRTRYTKIAIGLAIAVAVAVIALVLYLLSG